MVNRLRQFFCRHRRVKTMRVEMYRPVTRRLDWDCILLCACQSCGVKCWVEVQTNAGAILNAEIHYNAVPVRRFQPSLRETFKNVFAECDRLGVAYTINE